MKIFHDHFIKSGIVCPLLLIIGLISVLNSCKTVWIHFEKPQPASCKNLSHFKRSYRGHYISVSFKKDDMYYCDSTIMEIRYDSILKYKKSTALIPKFRFDSITADTSNHLKITGDKIIETEDAETVAFPYTVLNDTVHINLEQQEPALWFSISPQGILRRFRHKYYLNVKTPDNRWEISRMEKGRQGSIILSNLSDTADIKLLEKFQMIKKEVYKMKMNEKSTDSTRNIEGYISDPSLKQFKKFIKAGGFSVREKFKRKR